MARAGEHDRGYAVVASAVHALAQRSATAAREIKTLNGDSTQEIEPGCKLVGESGTARQDMLDRVNRASEPLRNLAQAGRSQRDGIGEVYAPIARIDTVT